jgi:hypothetical protein
MIKTMKNINEKIALVRQEIKNIDEKLTKLYDEGFKKNQIRIEDLEAKQNLLKDEREELIAKTV